MEKNFIIKEATAMSKAKSLYDNPLLTCTIVSDTHIDYKHPMPFIPKFLLKSAINDCAKSKCDAFIIIGDTTSRGSEINWEMAREVFKKAKKPAEHTLIAIGNHDTWDDESTEIAMKRYFDSTAEITGVKREKTYFKEVIKGYHFIFIGGEKDNGCGAYMTDEQIAFLEDALNESDKSEKPVFVFCHQSINMKHGLPRTFDKDEQDRDPFEGGIGARSDEVEAILKKHKNIFYFSGHSHMGISGEARYKKEGYASFEKDDNITLINVGSLACGNHHGDDNSPAQGMNLEVYEDKVVIRPRNYFKHKWISNLDIQGGKSHYEEKSGE